MGGSAVRDHEEELEELRYPIGRFRPRPTLSPDDRAALIEEIAALPAALRAAVGDLSSEQLDTAYRPGGWTLRQVVHHVADSHMNAYIRFRWALTEEEPTIKAYDEAAWAELPDARGEDVEVSLALLAALHGRWTRLLRSLDAAAFARALRHPESGLLTLDGMLQLYAWHGAHHVAHVTRLREREVW